MPQDIFISYRRDDEPGMATALYFELEKAFSADSLFMDVEGGISPGDDFVTVLESQVAKCNVMLAMVGKGWLTAADVDGQRRIDNPEDFVRIEIESAIRLGKRVIPVLINRTEMPRATNLPTSMGALARRHAVRLTQERFRADAKGLVEAIKRALVEIEENRAAAQAAATAATAAEAAERERIGAEAAAARATEAAERERSEAEATAARAAEAAERERSDAEATAARAAGIKLRIAEPGVHSARRLLEAVEGDDEDGHDPAAAKSGPRELPRNAARPRTTSVRAPGERRSLLDSGLRDFREVVSEANELGGASARANRSARETFANVPQPEANRSAQRGTDSDESYLTLDDITEPVMLEPSFVADESRPIPPRARQAPPGEVERERERAQTPRRSYGDLIRIAAAIVIVLAIGSLLIWQWPNMVAIYSMLWAPPAEVVSTSTPPSSKPKLPDRIEPGDKPNPQQQVAQDAATVAQRVVLYEEDPNDPAGKRAVGSVIWRTEAITAVTAKTPELAVRADIEIPERKISMTWTLRRDTDPGRSTSHTIEIMFTLPPDFPSGGIMNVPGIWMKQAEQTQGTALLGLAVQVTKGYYLIGLSSAPADKEHNVQLLKERPWFDIPIVYTNNRRAILAMEKGTTGERAFAQAFAAWEK
jgi:hypothetical protein